MKVSKATLDDVSGIILYSMELPNSDNVFLRPDRIGIFSF